MKKLIAFLYILLLAGLAGCFVMPVEDPVPPPPITPVPVPRVLRTVEAARGDVLAYANLFVRLVPAQEERLLFPQQPNTRISGIYVQAGDTVMPGDIVASLYRPAVQARYADALDAEDMLRLDIAHLALRHERALAQAEELGVPVDDSHFLAEGERLQRELYLMQLTIEHLRAENELRYLRATIGGTVMEAAVFHTAMTTASNTPIARIAEQAISILEMRVPPTVDIPPIQPGQLFTLFSGNNLYSVVAIDLAAFGIERNTLHGDEVYLELVDTTITLPPRFTGQIQFVQQASYDTLLLPPRAVHRIDGRTFVYILNEYGVLTIRDIETGLRGNYFYEILSGLEEGEEVVLS
jgi:multidrug efflux pump subunit AcrA (membrane-fusion protein)